MTNHHAEVMQYLAGPQSDWLLHDAETDCSLSWNLMINADGTTHVFFTVWDGINEGELAFSTLIDALDCFELLVGEIEEIED